MTISQTESGLGAADYTAVSELTEAMSARVLLQRLGPVWSIHNTNDRAAYGMDAMVVGDWIIRAFYNQDGVTLERMAIESSASEDWEAVDCSVSELADVTPSLTADGNQVRMFYYGTDDKIKVAQWGDISASSPSMGSVSECVSVSDVLFVDAVSLSEAHYITETDSDNRRMHMLQYSEGWDTTDSDVFWPFPIFGADAVTLEDKKVVLLSTELPPLLGSRVVGTNVETEVNRVLGVVAFHVNNGRWSDHYQFDVIDRVPDAYPIGLTPDALRADIRARVYDGMIFASYMRAGGAGNYGHGYVSVTRSRDGVGWEFPEYVYDATAPCVILPRSDYLYAACADKLLRSPRCVWGTQAPEEIDITAYVTQLSSNAADIRETRLALSNPNEPGVADQRALDGTLLDDEARMRLEVELGYYDEDGTPLRTLVESSDVVSIGNSLDVPRERVTLQARDVIDRLNRGESDYAMECPSMQAGADDYESVTGTDYGGLKHTAPYEGHWETPGDNELHLLSNNKEGLAVSTFVTNALNGSISTAFTLHTSGEGEYAGLSFRVHDKDNLHYVAYFLDDDVVRLYRRRGTDNDAGYSDTLLATSNAVDGSEAGEPDFSEDTQGWMKVVVRYGLCWVYVSSDGVTWHELDWSGDTSPIELQGATLR